MDIRKYLSQIGSKGGKVTGAAKRRGDSEYYRGISRKGVAARKKKAKKKAKK
jgi:general stress protein YciG